MSFTFDEYSHIILQKFFLPASWPWFHWVCCAWDLGLVKASSDFSSQVKAPVGLRMKVVVLRVKLDPSLRRFSWPLTDASPLVTLTLGTSHSLLWSSVCSLVDGNICPVTSLLQLSLSMQVLSSSRHQALCILPPGTISRHKEGRERKGIYVVFYCDVCHDMCTMPSRTSSVFRMGWCVDERGNDGS